MICTICKKTVCPFCQKTVKAEDLTNQGCPVCTKEANRTEPLECNDCGHSEMKFVSHNSTGYSIKHLCPKCYSNNVYDPDVGIRKEVEDFIGLWGYPSGTNPWVDNDTLEKFLESDNKDDWVEPENQDQWDSFTSKEKRYVITAVNEWLYG